MVRLTSGGPVTSTTSSPWRSARDLLVPSIALAVDLLVWGLDRELRWGGQLPLAVIPALGLAVYPTLLARWRRPVAVFGVQWLFALTGAVVPQCEPFVGLLVALHALACTCPPRVAVAALAACAMPFGINTYNAVTYEGGDVNPVVPVALWTVLALSAWGWGRLMAIAESRARETQALQAAVSAHQVQAERLRLARELHDIVAHALSVVVLQAAGARQVRDREPERTEQALQVIEDVGVQAMRELHRMLGLLRSDVEDEASPDEPGEARTENLPALVEVARASGLDVQLTSAGAPRPLDESIETAAYRIVQESLTNVAKHAGRGASVHVHLDWRPEQLTVAVRNTHGLGAQPGSVHPAVAVLSSGRGLRGLAERLEPLGGRLESGPVPGGYLLTADLPFTAAGRSWPGRDVAARDAR